jgi:hypothetical protein
LNLTGFLDTGLTGLVGLAFVLVFLGVMIFYSMLRREPGDRPLRKIPAFSRLSQAIGLAVEAGKRLHISLGRGMLFDLQGGSALVGLSMLARITQVASISDRPPVATSGEGSLAVLSRDTLRGTYREVGQFSQYDPISGRLTGLTPFSYAVGTMPVIFDEQISASILAGHFGSEIALITDAGERNESMTLAGSDNLSAQAVLYAAAQEPLIGEELYAAGAYMNAGPAHSASVRAQDYLRWALVLAILIGSALKLLGAL